MLLRLYNDESPLEDHSKDRFASKAEGITDTTMEVGSVEEENGSSDGDVEQQQDKDMRDENADEDPNAVTSSLVNKLTDVDDLGLPGPGEEDIVGVSGLETKGGEDDMPMRDTGGLSIEEQAEKEVRVAVGLED